MVILQFFSCRITIDKNNCFCLHKLQNKYNKIEFNFWHINDTKYEKFSLSSFMVRTWCHNKFQSMCQLSGLYLWNISILLPTYLIHEELCKWSIFFFPCRSIELFLDIYSLSSFLICDKLFFRIVYWESVMFHTFKTHSNWWHSSCTNAK